MKKFWVILLSLGLIMAFAMPAAAVDVKFSGQYYAQGFYVDNNSLLDKNEPANRTVAQGNTWQAGGAGAGANASAYGANGALQRMNQRGAAALYSQRLRISTEFQVVEGLKLVTRFDALEKAWGSSNWAGGTGETQTRRAWVTTEGGTTVGNANSVTNVQENIEFERAYVDFNVPFGKFQVGYQQFMMWGTDFLNTPLTAAGIRYLGQAGPFSWVAAIEKRMDFAASYVGNQPTTTSNIGRANDGDNDVYDLGGIYKFKAGEAGILWQYSRVAGATSAGNTGKTASIANANGNAYELKSMNLFLPYTKLNFGPAFIEAEGLYGTGSFNAYESTIYGGPNNATQNVNASQLGVFLHGKYDFKPAYAGVQFVYLSGDDMEQTDKITGGMAQFMKGGYGFDRTLILWNSNYQDSGFSNAGAIPCGAATTGRSGMPYAPGYYMDNVWFYQIYAGFKPMAKMDLRLAWSYANADKKPRSQVGKVGDAGTNGVVITEYASNNYGQEWDLTATYKIYDNLEYMIGAGYLKTGDYFKAFNVNNVVKDNYLVTHKLTLNF